MCTSKICSNIEQVKSWNLIGSKFSCCHIIASLAQTRIIQYIVEDYCVPIPCTNPLTNLVITTEGVWQTKEQKQSNRILRYLCHWQGCWLGHHHRDSFGSSPLHTAFRHAPQRRGHRHSGHSRLSRRHKDLPGEGPAGRAVWQGWPSQAVVAGQTHGRHAQEEGGRSGQSGDRHHSQTEAVGGRTASWTQREDHYKVCFHRCLNQNNILCATIMNSSQMLG